MPYTIVAHGPQREGATLSDVEDSPQEAVSRARELVGQGYDVLVTDPSGEAFTPERFDELLSNAKQADPPQRTDA